MTLRKYFVFGLLLFALFLGAGNIIFPPHLGQMAGEKLGVSIFGFLITAVGLPLLAILAIAYSEGGLRSIANRVGLLFGLVFTLMVYLAIGPFFGIPRTATVSYEIGILPFLSGDMTEMKWPLFLFTIAFFVITIFLSLNPAKLVNRIGKVLTPLLFVVIGALAVKSIVTPIGDLGPVQGDFQSHPFFSSFVEGYLTMDVIGALVFGSMIIQAVHAEGIYEKKSVLKAMVIASVVAAIGLAFVYLSLAYIGATSVGAIGIQENGGQVLALASTYLYGEIGKVLLAVTIILACLTTAIGLVSACAQFFSQAFPKVSYKVYVFIFATFSMVLSNFGLTELIAISVPVLMMIYPLAIVLIFLSFIDRIFQRKQAVYLFGLVPTAIISILSSLLEAGLHMPLAAELLEHLPLFEQKIGWLVPALIGTIIGILLSPFFNKIVQTEETSNR